jgi:hypothetical protein
MTTKRLVLLVAAWAGFWVAGPGLAQTVLTVDEAAKRIGETVTFEGKVMGVAASPEFKATYVSFGGAYPRQKLSVLFAGDYEAFLTSCQLPRLNERTVRVTGKVEKGKKGPVVRVTNLAQVVVAEVKERVSLYADGDGPVFRKQMRATLADLFAAEDYAALDKVAAEWSQGKARFLDGNWKIARFYDAIMDMEMSLPERFKRLETWQATYPDSITPRLFHAEAMVKYAWEARGNGVASTVTEEGWKLFKERLATARMELAALNARRTECPHWFVVMQTIALGQGWSREEYEALFDEAIRNDPEYLTFYERKIYYLQPKWYGEEGDELKFVNSLPERVPGGVGEEIYARLAWSGMAAANQRLRESGGRYFPDMGLKWEPMKAGFERICARFPKSNRMRNAYAIFAGKASDWETCNRLLLEIGDQFDMDLWATWENVAAARMWAAGKGLPDTIVNQFR